MPWKTIGYILAALIVILFIAFNLSNTSDISFIFFSVQEVPVFFTVFISIIIGCLAMLPVTLSQRRKKKKREKEDDISFDELLKTHDTTVEKPKKKRNKKKDKYGESEDVSDIDTRP